MKRFIKLLLLITLLGIAILVMASPALADSYASRVNAFLNDSRWKDGVWWGDGKRPEVSTYNCYECFAYAADFSNQCWASHPRYFGDNGVLFYNASEIRDGDVIWTGGHYWVVIQRKGDMLWTCEGNVKPYEGASDGYVWVRTDWHSMNNLRGFSKGWHNPDYESYESIPSGKPMSQGYDRAIPDGDYLVATAATTDKSSFYYLDIPGVDVPAPSETNVWLYGPNVDVPAHEIWTLKYSDGFYTIKQKGSNISLDVYGASLEAGTNVWTYSYNGSDAQLWAISRDDNNGYTIQSKCNGFALDIKAADISKCANVQVFTVNGNDNQSWLFIPYQPEQPLSEDRYIIVSSADDRKIVDVPGDTGNISEGTTIQINSDNGQNRYNSFDVTKLSNGYYTITHAASGKALEVYGGVSTKEAKISLRTPKDSTSQQWQIKSESNDTYSIIVRSSGFFMNHANTDNDAPIVQWYYNGLTTQKWFLVKAEHIVKYDLNDGSGKQSIQTKYYKNDLVLSSIEPEREGYMFTGWNTHSDGSGLSYRCGDAYVQDVDLTLYAQWQPMTRLVLPAGLVTIDEEAFSGIDTYIVVVPDGCTTISNRAFADNDKLTQIVIPATVNNIAFDAFENCGNLTIYAPDDSTAIRLAKALSIPYKIVE